MQKAINAFRFNVKLSHCLTRKKKHDLDQETTKKSLECKRTTAHYIHVPFAKYHIMGVWETSYSLDIMALSKQDPSMHIQSTPDNSI